MAQQGPPAGVAGPVAKLYDEEKDVPAEQFWAHEVTSRRGGTISFRVTCPGPFVVTVLTSQGIAKRKRRQRFQKEDVLLTQESKGPTLEGAVTLGPGSSWFVIENHTKQPTKIRLECFGD
jgi:hypothetical protein